MILSFSETCSDFIEASPKSMYNCYKLLGFDVLVDNNLKVLNGISKVNELIIISLTNFERTKTILVSIVFFSKVHLMEVNARPELKDDIIDKTVNRPMVCFFTYYIYKYVAIVKKIDSN